MPVILSQVFSLRYWTTQELLYPFSTWEGGWGLVPFKSMKERSTQTGWRPFALLVSDPHSILLLLFLKNHAMGIFTEENNMQVECSQTAHLFKRKPAMWCDVTDKMKWRGSSQMIENVCWLSQSCLCNRIILVHAICHHTTYLQSFFRRNDFPSVHWL